MKKVFQKIGIFIFLNLITIIIGSFFWNFIISLLIIETPFINVLNIYGVYLFLILINIYLINSKIKMFISKKIILIISLVITILFSIFINIKGDDYNLNENNRYESRINYPDDETLILFYKYSPLSKKIKINTNETIFYKTSATFYQIKNGNLYWYTLNNKNKQISDKYGNLGYYKTNLSNGKTIFTILK